MSLASETSYAIARTWLSSFASALASHDANAVAAEFLPNGWLRDMLTFTWDNRSLEGTDQIARYMSENLQKVDVTRLSLCEDEHFRPVPFEARPGVQGVEFGYTYETAIALGKGFAKIVPDSSGTWKAFAASMIIMDLKGYEETPGRQNFEIGLDGQSWGDAEAERKGKIQSDPHVLVLGAGQAGLHVAARFTRMNIPTLVIEKNQRVGDNWRKRYRSLALHTTREQLSMLYQEWPSTWPIFTPRDKMADALEAYVSSQDLVVWTRSQLSMKPTYDSETRRWTVTIDHAGTEVVLHPAHIVLATGVLGAPHIPVVDHRELFPGTAIHSSAYDAPAAFIGQDVVVIGAASTAIDICQDLASNGAKSVTMVQRSPTCVVSRTSTQAQLERIWQPGVPAEVGDFKFMSNPFGLFKKIMMSRQAQQWEAEKELHAKLRKAGVALSLGPDGQGQFLLVFERGGGFWIDKGAADLLASGAIRVKSGVHPVSFTPDGLSFSDGSTLNADAVVFATGYENMRKSIAKWFGEDIVNSTSAINGLDGEGEIRGLFRPSGHPGFWYAGGGPIQMRFQSKQLGLQILAEDLGWSHNARA